MAPLIDPLEGLEYRPLEVQVAVLANEMRNQKNALEAAIATLTDEVKAARRVAITMFASSFVTVLTFALMAFYSTRSGR